MKFELQNGQAVSNRVMPFYKCALIIKIGLLWNVGIRRAMTDEADAKMTLMEEFKAITTKQLLATAVGFGACVMLTVYGFALSALGFLLVAVILYMVPHLMGILSPKVKAVIGVMFLVVMLLIAAFAFTNAAQDAKMLPSSNVEMTDVTYEGNVIAIVSDSPDLTIVATYNEITMMSFGMPIQPDESKAVSFSFTYEDGKYTASPNIPSGGYYYILIKCERDGGNDYCQILTNTGIDSGKLMSMNIMGSMFVVGEIMLVFFIMIVFSELMRRSAKKKRAQMEKDGRLYPKGYSRCKKCGTIVLPGEINCRKCGEPIDVPEEVKVLHKKDFFECSECGTEVPMDAKMCPKCGAVFDEADEAEVTHADGSVDSSTETFECSECGKEVPANATRCPYCGAEFDEE